ncbi:MAG: adenylate/guanylate cyclase domain-containing protein [Desulfobacteraceae bacterium]|jgi:class 3 adenylate cyclase
MSRTDCISNRNISIVSTYLLKKTGSYSALFHDLPFPSDRYESPEAFFLNEDEWTTYDNFQKILRRAKDLSEEPYFYFNCGSSSAMLRSWGRFGYLVRFFAGPDDGFKRLSFFNSNINDTKDIDVIIPPSYDKTLKRVRVILKVSYHDDIDVNYDYIQDAYRRGIISSIPTLWGLSPAKIKQPLYAYDPVILLNNEPEFAEFELDAKMEDGYLTITDPIEKERKRVGKKISLVSDRVNEKEIFLGRYSEQGLSGDNAKKPGAILITETVRGDDRILLRKGEIYNAPYFILDVTYNRFSWLKRCIKVLKKKRNKSDSEMQLVDTINNLRINIKERNRAYDRLRTINEELEDAKAILENYNVTLEQKVDERTIELKKAREELLILNEGLEEKVNSQIEELNKYNNLRRYLSPTVAEKILSNENTMWAVPRRKMMTVMFTDIRNFSTFTDNLEPEELFNLLHNYISEMTKIVYRYDGTLNKIIGDGLLIFLGDPVPMDDHARRAVMMGIDMQKKTEELKKDWRYFGYEFGMGIGINTGYMTVGNIGSEMQLDYTVIGNQVNVASRLESNAKAGQILISQRTYSSVSDLVEADKIGEITVKGIHNPVLTYNVRCLKSA